MRVLVIGGAGYVGAILRPTLEEHHDCTFMDLRPVAGARGPCLIGDVDDEAALARAVAGQEAAVWLAMGGSVADNNSQCLSGPAFDVNVRGFFRFLQAAERVKIRRIVFSSSLSIYERLRRRPGEPVCERLAPDAWQPYGVSKRLAEGLCRMYVQQVPEATVVSLRLMLPRNEADWPGNEYAAGKSYHPLGPQDAQTLYLAALQLEKPGAHAVQATGDLGGELYPNDAATTLLGWAPQGR